MGGVKRQSYLPYIVGVLGLVVLVAAGERLAQSISSLFNDNLTKSAEVGRVSDGHGSVTRVRGAAREARADAPLGLNDGDRVETGDDATATVVLGSQDELEITARSSVAFELWGEGDPNSPIYVHVLAGDVISKHAGVRGRAYVVRDGRLYLPAQRPGAKLPPLVITRAAGDDAAAPALSPETPIDSSAKDGLDTPPPVKSADPDTLANEYVEEMIASRQPQLQKCWLSRLKDKPGLKGKLTVQFEITRRGKVRDATVVDSSLDDEQLGHCVISAMERIPFRSFGGPEISIAYPISFE